MKNKNKKNKLKNSLFFHIFKSLTYIVGEENMDKEIITGNHTVNMVKRSNINISGVKKIENFNENEFLLETIMGYMTIKGHDLEIIKLDTYQGDVAIKGKIDSIIYSDIANKKNKEESIFSKLFK